MARATARSRPKPTLRATGARARRAAQKKPRRLGPQPGVRRIAVIGGSGMYQMPGLKDVREVKVKTPFGNPSDAFILGCVEEAPGAELVFLARHNRKHTFLPSEVPYRANIYGLKMLGVQIVVAAGACGSMQELYRPGDFVFVDQFFDRTRLRAATFYGNGAVGHVSFADPVYGPLAQVLYAAATRLKDTRAHFGGTYMCMEGPAFSTRSESRIYRQWGVDVIGMTNLTEAKLARETGLAYATMAMVTDYDCWHQSEEDVTIEEVLRVLRENAERARAVVLGALPDLVRLDTAPCLAEARKALLTPWDAIPARMQARLRVILGPEFRP